MAKKVQLPVIGGIRKVITPGGGVAVGTTIAELGSKTVSLAQLAALLATFDAPSTGTIGNAATASLIPGPGLSGGGSLLGAVPIRLTAPMALMPDDGADGDMGPPGKDGIIGRDGATGPAGTPFFGIDGDDGQDGLPGFAGPPGGTGATGATGPAGTPFFGTDGDDGQDGLPGFAGPPGITGAPGVAGAIGLSGFDGENGEDGLPGIPGPQGPSGVVAVGIPGTTPDLILWWESDNILGAAGLLIPALQQRTPWVTGLAGTAPSASAWTVSATKINSLNTLKTGIAGAGGYNLVAPFLLPNGATIFIVVNPGSAASAEQAIIGGATNSLAVSLNSSGGANTFTIIKSSTAVIGSSTAVWSVGTPFQANVTYNQATGAFAFRQARATAGSGTGATGAGVSTLTNFIGADAVLTTANMVSASIAAVIVYSRVLSGAEITAIENYLFNKWGV